MAVPDAGMLRFLAIALRARREAAALTRRDIATEAGVEEAVVSALENAEAWPAVGADRLANAYARLCEVPWFDLWQDAMIEAQVERAIQQAADRKK